MKDNSREADTHSIYHSPSPALQANTNGRVNGADDQREAVFVIFFSPPSNVRNPRNKGPLKMLVTRKDLETL